MKTLSGWNPRWARRAAFFAGVVCLALSSFAQAPTASVNAAEPLPQDTGTNGLKLMLRRLHTTGRLMQVVAHPDDEDGGMLTLESRGEGVTALLLTLNRGEGGQNKVGSNLFDVLGVLRALELTASDRYYGVEQRFTRVADFGFSKSPEESFQKWQGHDVALGDMVRVIRTFHPDVLVARFSGTERDGHGHHQASAILAQEAFRAAADPTRFPEQIREGLRPWQAQKFYVGNVCGFGATSCPAENYNVKLNTGKVDPLLGMSYVQFAMEGLRHQLSQGAGGWTVDPGDRFTYYKLVDSALQPPPDKNAHEDDFFDEIDTSLFGLDERLGAEEPKALLLKAALKQIQGRIAEATAAADKDSLAAVSPLVEGNRTLGLLINTIKSSQLSPAAKNVILLPLQEKADQFVKAIALAQGVQLSVAADVPVAANPDDAFMAVPGQTFRVTAKFSAEDPAAKLTDHKLDLPAAWRSRVLTTQHVGKEDVTRFEVSVPQNAAYTRPYWHRGNPETDSINTVDDPQYVTLAFPPAPVQVSGTLADAGTISSACMVQYKDEKGKLAARALAVAPAFSVALDPGEQVIPVGGASASEVTVAVTSNLAGAKGVLHLEVPANWKVQPAQIAVAFGQAREKKELRFKVIPASLKQGRAEVRAVLVSGQQKYSEGYSVVTREDLDTFYYYQPAVQRVSIVDVKVSAGLKVGYIMGAGDDIPTVLRQIGMDVSLISPDKLGSENLDQFGTIVLGIRAYDTQKDVVAHNKKLLEFVANGGTLVVQYNAGVGDFNSGHLTPYPATLGRARVSVEEAPIEILAAQDRVFSYPNTITQRDFEGWVQERGLYFMDQWDSNFKPLLASHDPGEAALKGGLLEAKFGKGEYIYTGYAFFRQLPAGVPGAIRLYVNLLSAGSKSQ